MAEEQQTRLQSAVDVMVKNLERENIRKMQVRRSPQICYCLGGQKGVEEAGHGVNRRQNLGHTHTHTHTRNELERFKDRLARCTMHCNDKAKDAFESGNKEAQVKVQLETCVIKCVDEHMNLIPSMTRKLKDALSDADK
ncbi:hypothetical protein FKM82_028324 [Ascaphus truei]